jgi:hypothetical protein
VSLGEEEEGIAREFAEGGEVEVVVVAVGEEDEIDGGKVFDAEARRLQAVHSEEGNGGAVVGEDGVEENGVAGALEEPGGVSDPSGLPVGGAGMVNLGEVRRGERRGEIPEGGVMIVRGAKSEFPA